MTVTPNYDRAAYAIIESVYAVYSMHPTNPPQRLKEQPIIT